MNRHFKLFIIFISMLNYQTFSFLRNKFKPISKTLLRDSSTMARVILEKGKARLFQDGNPIIYGGAIKEIIGNPSSGDECEVVDNMLNILGRGVYNGISQYRVRVLARRYEDSIYLLPLQKLLEHRIKAAKELRTQINLPNLNSTVYRLINGEGDKLSGLIVDVLGCIVVAQSSALWVEKHRPAIHEALLNILGKEATIVWRRSDARLKQDGWSEIPEDEIIDNIDLEEKIIIKENGIDFFVYPKEGQKTGFYCDQRDNRRMIRELSQNKDVLDTYCYTGGFSLSAAAGGARSVIAVDSSAPALLVAEQNAVRNGFQDRIQLVQSDAMEYMRGLKADGKLFDLVICDPPKLAPTRTSLDKAKNKYIKINALAMSLVKPGGLLLTCSCSGAVTQGDLLASFVSEAAQVARRDVTVLTKSSAAADHPVYIGYKEGAYLTALLLRIL